MKFRRRVGAVRPSHLMFTSGIGSLVDLPNFSVLVRGTDDWTYFPSKPETVDERRLLAAVQRVDGLQDVTTLQKAPWMDGTDADPDGEASRVGVPVDPFPTWLRCTACNELAPLTTSVFRFVNDIPSRPHEAKFVHGCRRSGKPPLAVAARFVLACSNGHLDDFPYVHFVHQGTGCPNERVPKMEMHDRSANLGANVEVRCKACGASRNMREALGKLGEKNLPDCRARNAHLRTFSDEGCDQKPKTLVVGASNQWFSRTLSALAVPRTGQNELASLVEKYWDNISGVNREALAFARRAVPEFQHFSSFPDDAELWAAIEAHQARLDGGGDEEPDSTDLRAEEWQAFTEQPFRDPTLDFALHEPALAPEITAYVERLIQVERVREARALVGFTRLDAPDPEDPTLVKTAPLSRSTNPTWVPATEVRGEGLFVKLPEHRMAEWEQEIADLPAVAEHLEAYGRFRANRYSDRVPGSFDRYKFWPGPRFIALHTLSHLLIRTIALECGYSSASLSERIYASAEDDERAGILIYTAVPDAEGTLGGLVSLGEPREFSRIFRRALRDADRCSSDPLCVERAPVHGDFLHGAACHVCLFVSETTCERGNRFLDRRFVVPVAPGIPSLFKDLP